MSDEPFGLSGAALAREIAAGRLSSRAVVAAHIQRIEAVNPALNALVAQRFELAHSEAAAADERQAAGEALGPMHGVPITIKESFHVAGMASTMGLTAHANNIQSADGPLVTRLKAAGAIVLGKTNVPQLMLMHETDNPLYGRTNNPWNLERTSGGSSGGEAALIAAGGSPWGLASDLGGSIRLPCHFCGVTGIKPTSQRLTRTGGIGNLRGMDAIHFQPGPIARSVDDLGHMLTVLAGDPTQSLEFDVAPALWRYEPDTSVRGLKIGYWEDNGHFPYAPAVKRAVREAVGHLSAAGANVVAVAPPKVATAMYLYTALIAADGAADARRLLKGSRVDDRIARLVLLGRLPNWLRPLVTWCLTAIGHKERAGLVRAARRRTADEYWQLTTWLNGLRRRYQHEVLAKFDALVLPPYALPAPRHGQAVDLISAAGDTFFVNLLGAPAGVVPITRVRPGEEAGRTAGRELAQRTAASCESESAGLPVGVQVVANYWREDLCLRVMAALDAVARQSADYPHTPVTPL